MNEAELAAALEDGSLPESEFRHRQHLQVGYYYLREFGFAEAISRMARALRSYATARGKEQLYHETITVAFLSLINERIARTGDGGGWEGFAAANPDLLDRRLLSHYYRPETLHSAIARKVFVMGEFAARPYLANDSLTR